MTNERIIDLLTIERQCVLRNRDGQCDRECARCDLVQDDAELERMYDLAICIVKDCTPEQPVWADGAHIYCPSCMETIYGWMNFCPGCGKALDWRMKELAK